jgi:hypothetical protein
LISELRVCSAACFKGGKFDLDTHWWLTHKKPLSIDISRRSSNNRLQWRFRLPIELVDIFFCDAEKWDTYHSTVPSWFCLSHSESLRTMIILSDSSMDAAVLAPF